MGQIVGAVRCATWVCIVAGGLALVFSPERAPASVVPGLLLAFVPLARGWRAARGTALRAAAVWGSLAIGLGLIAEVLAMGEPLSGGRPSAGHATYLCVLTALAALLSVLNARTPGGSAWAILMSLLVLVFLIPWLEGPGLGRALRGLGRLRLDQPWSLFYGLVVIAGVTNYLPTRYGPAAALLGLGFVLEYAGLTRLDGSPEPRATLWTAVPWTFAAAVATADLRATAAPRSSCRFEAVWFWFRDHWGVVWALRLLERFNKSAESLGWPIRLAWHGVISTDGGPNPAVPDAAEATLRGLTRRFATPGRVEEVVSALGDTIANNPSLAEDR